MLIEVTNVRQVNFSALYKDTGTKTNSEEPQCGISSGSALFANI